jgi:uncharacterized protein YqjF (DUF2071 family)
MLAFLKNHPFAVEAFFESSLVLTYAIAKEELQDLIPECLELDIYDNKWAFVAVAMVQTKNLRPKGFPKFMGNNFFLTGYRVFVRYTTAAGKKLRGLYILKSETDKKKMQFFGNIFTHYNYTTTDISIDKSLANEIHIQSKQSDIDVEVITNEEAILPNTSPFPDWATARRYAGPLPFTFTYNKSKKEVLIIQGVREDWVPKPITIQKADIGFIKKKAFKNIQLANAFIIEHIPYYWKKGKIEKWTPQ